MNWSDLDKFSYKFRELIETGAYELVLDLGWEANSKKSITKASNTFMALIEGNNLIMLIIV